MTNPHQNPFGGNPLDPGPAGLPPVGMPSARRDEVNTLATLSLIFAFVFAPAGAVLGHLGLSQIARTGQLGRRRAVTGLIASYALITVSAIALTVWLIQPHTARSHQGETPAGPPGVDLAALLPTTEQLKALLDDPDLAPRQPIIAIADSPGSIDRPDCWALVSLGDRRVYDTVAVRGFYRDDYADPASLPRGFQLGQSVAAYDTPAAATAAARKIAADMSSCTGTSIVFTPANGQKLTLYAESVQDTADHISTQRIVTFGTQPQLFIERAVTAKAGLVVDVISEYVTGYNPRIQATVAAILSKIIG